jgi:site-specific recombinase XerD
MSDAPSPQKLLDRVREALRVRRYSPRTEESYVPWMRRLIAFHGMRHPSELGEREVSAFLSKLAADGVAASTQNRALSAILFLYRVVLEQDLPWLHGLVRAQRPSRLPVVLSRDEVGRLLAHMSGVPGLMGR